MFDQGYEQTLLKLPMPEGAENSNPAALLGYT
jgi:hypothetical protein